MWDLDFSVFCFHMLSYKFKKVIIGYTTQKASFHPSEHSLIIFSGCFYWYSFSDRRTHHRHQQSRECRAIHKKENKEHENAFGLAFLGKINSSKGIKTQEAEKEKEHLLNTVLSLPVLLFWFCKSFLFSFMKTER